MSDETTPAAGMRDFLPEEMSRRGAIFDTVRDVYESYGFEPLETPAIERLSTLLGKYGEEEKLIFKILKRGEKLDRALEGDPDESDLADLALRYDLTVPLARIVAQYQQQLPQTLKRYQIEPVWRADRPQKGRYREFVQCDVDVVGSDSMVVEAEVTAALSEVLQRLGFEDFRIHTNHRELLRALMETAGVAEELRDEALIAIDKLDKVGVDGVASELENRGIDDEAIDALLPMLERESDDDRTVLARLANQVETESGQTALSELETLLDYASGGPAADHLHVDPYLARGLAYYTGPIFEIRLPGVDSSLGGGGRYDELIGMFTQQEIPACGFSLGVERIYVLMEEREMFAEERPSADALVTVWNEELAPKSIELAAELRSAGLSVDLYPSDDDRLGDQFGYADTRDIPYVLILAPDEVEEGVVAVKDMDSGEQVEVDRGEIAEELEGRLD
ncbi:MAG: histidine--tRNA ligase [Bradymonadaceae bacterium]